jgi:hypothetical protein
MSFTKIHHILPHKIDDQQVAKRVSQALRENHLDVASTIKNIGQITGINSNTIAKWHRHQNPPKSAHLLALAAHYPAVLRAICEIIGWPELWHAALRENIPQRMQMRLQESSSYYQSRGDKSVTPRNPEVGLLSPTLNRRQVWFLEEIRKGRRLTSTDLAISWRVAERTAKRDIGELVSTGHIRFHKAGRIGWYERHEK